MVNIFKKNEAPANYWGLIVSIVALISFSVGSWTATSNCPKLPPADVDLSLFWQAWHELEDNFVDKNQIDHQKMVYGAISGMVASLEDPYTAFFNPVDAKKFLEDTSGSFEGVGMEIGVKQNQLRVIAPLENSPAQKADIRAGDFIVQIDGKSTAGITSDEAVNLIRGPKGTQVVLTMFREDWKETRDIEIARDVINVPSLKWEIKDGDIAYIQLYQFTEKAGVDFRAAAVDIINSPAKAIVLDLRNNPGGYLSVAQDIAGWFLKKGQIVTRENFGEKRPEEEHKSAGPSLLEKYPITIIINEGSASASEILAGALRDNRQVQLVGKQSFGKGSVQQLMPLANESSLKVTIARWLTPNGDQISEKGLMPDIEVEISAEDEEKEIDPQLDKAIEIVKTLR
jgi:carboxyl-terminal processing protease